MFANKRWCIVVLLAFLLVPVLAMNPAASAAEIKDLNSCSAYARPAVERLVAQGIITGDTQGNFLPQTSVTRGEMVTIIVRALKIEPTAKPTKATFKDVPIGHWANPYVETALARGIVKGVSSDRFGVNQLCSREEMAVMFVRSFQVLDKSGSVLALPTANLSSFTDNNKISLWAREAMGFAFYSGILFGTSESTISPQALAVREQSAVLVDRFLNRYQTIKADRQAALLLNNAGKQLTNASMLTNNSFSKTEFTLWQAYEDLPSNFSITTDTINRGIWPGQIYSLTKLTMPGLPQSEYPPYSLEQYLADGVVYEKVTDGTSSNGWEHYPAMSTDEVNQVMSTVKESLTAMLEPGLIAHQTGACSVETTTVNDAAVNKITYTGKITDLESYLLEVLPTLVPQDTSSPQSWMEDLLATFTDANFIQIYYIRTADGKLIGSDFNLQVNCQATADKNITPIKSMIISAGTNTYAYDNIVITLPDLAKSAPEKQVK